MLDTSRYGPLSLGMIAVLVLGCATTAPPQSTKEDIAPESGSGLRALKPVFGQTMMFAAANPHATQAGFEMLQQGGSAVDAAIAAALVLTLVEPQSSGIGGGAFMLVFDPETGAVHAYDGRETAPASAEPGMFLDAEGKPQKFWDAVIGGRSVGVPGMIRLFEDVHKDHGQLPWKALFQPAERLARDGFALSPRLHSLLVAFPFPKDMSAGHSFYHQADGAPKPVGTILKNSAYGDTLAILAREGARGFYEGPVAQDICRAVSDAVRNASPLTLADLAAYRAKKRAAVCAPYRAFEVCGMGPPSSGAITPLQILGVLAQFELAPLGVDSPALLHLFTEASRLAYADRSVYIADPDFAKLPQTLLDPGYLRQRARLIDPQKSMGAATPGTPPGPTQSWAPDRSPELPSTSHVVAVDVRGKAVSMTASIESAFGSRIMVRGFLLNNELTDFSFVPEANGKLVANRIEAGKRPRSSMAPMIVLKREGQKKHLHMAVGSPGGSRIINYVALALVRMIDFELSPQEAFNRPNVVNRNGPTELESMAGKDGWVTATKTALEKLGHVVKVRELNSGLQGFVRRATSWEGGADPRREGVVLGR